VITGADSFGFIPKELGLPAVVSGFEPEDIIRSCSMLLSQIREGRAELENQYKRAVTGEGNLLALKTMEEVLEPSDCRFRGMGTVPLGGFSIKPEYRKFDAKARFGLEYKDVPEPAGCRCGLVIQGKIEPAGCPLFGRVCTPANPVGPCMVSSEGSCAAAYKYSWEE
ncbi:MAG: hydrogenase formation protein HypD, partial [Firmicutes bacterium]|nr:hydrogenase formation protein HypD [Bacillota bacterium]